MIMCRGHNDIVSKTHVFESNDNKKLNIEKPSHFHKRNMNPWNKDIEDCAIRAVSAALWMKYETVCQIFGKECVPGIGLRGTEGINLKIIKHVLKNFFSRDVRQVTKMTIGQFCEEHSGQGRFLIASSGHMVYADLTPGRNWFMDTFDSSRLPVRSYMQVKGILRKDDPNSLAYRK